MSSSSTGTQIQENKAVQAVETDSRTIKHKQSGKGLLVFVSVFLIAGILCLIGVFFGEEILLKLPLDRTYVDNQVEIVQQETQTLAASVRTQRESLHNMEVRFADQKNETAERFATLEAKIERLEADLQALHTNSQVKQHRVKSGETLWKISMQYYGTGKYVGELALYNKIANPRHIISGSTLTIPPATLLR